MVDLYGLVEPLQSWLFETAILPVLYTLGESALADEVFDATGIILLGLLSIVVTFLLIRPLEAWIPVERWRNRRALRVDALYTLLEKSGLLPISFFLLLVPLWLPAQAWLHANGMTPWQLEELIPRLQTSPFLAFLAYALLLDFFEYWRHRWQHRFNWWWGLHSVHHSQQQMSFWCDSRNHLLDGLIQTVWLTAIAMAIGIQGSQFVGLVILMQLVESMSHVNARVSYGWFGERLIVSPRFHRVHHGIGEEQEGRNRGCNFAVLFPLWDILFGTARFDVEPGATGIRDQQQGAYYGEGFWEQQRVGLWRMLGLPVANHPTH
jgi:sterol desaturase/sphingolipid hydroxylase (fatty acid hydroxylase superfamily)